MCNTAHIDRWARETFDNPCILDQRVRERLVRVAAAQAKNPAAHTAATMSQADYEGAYRLYNNDSLNNGALVEAIGSATVRRCAEVDRPIVAVDSTDLVFTTKVTEQLGNVGGKTGSTARGLIATGALVIDPDHGGAYGLVDMDLRNRPEKRPGRAVRNQLPVHKKETYKWIAAYNNTKKRMGHRPFIFVADREADMHELMQHIDSDGGDFVVRAAYDRCVTKATKQDGGKAKAKAKADDQVKLWEVVAPTPVRGTRLVNVKQRGAVKGHSPKLARKARSVLTEYRATTVTLDPTRPGKGKYKKTPMQVNAVLVSEVEANVATGEDPIEWKLLTNLPIDTPDDIQRVIDIYEKRWRIEEFHKVWKSGCKVEKRLNRTVGPLIRVALVLAGIATMMMELDRLAEMNPHADALEYIPLDMLKVLWGLREKPLPKNFEEHVQGKAEAEAEAAVTANSGADSGAEGNGKAKANSSPRQVATAQRKTPRSAGVASADHANMSKVERPPITIQDFILELARLAHWHGKPKKSRPSFQTLWAGLFELMAAVKGYRLAKQHL